VVEFLQGCRGGVDLLTPVDAQRRARESSGTPGAFRR